MTVKQWRQLSKVPPWIVSIGQVAAGSSLWLKSKLSTSSEVRAHGSRRIRQPLLRLLFQQLGGRLIELYGGGKRSEPPRHTSATPALATPDAGGENLTLAKVTLAVVGETRIERSRLIRMLVDHDRAICERQKGTADALRYRVLIDRPPARLLILDIGETSPPSSDDELTEYEVDVVLIVFKVDRPISDVYSKMKACRQVWDSAAAIAVVDCSQGWLASRATEPAGLRAKTGPAELNLWEKARDWEQSVDVAFENVVPVAFDGPKVPQPIVERIQSAVTDELTPPQAAAFLQATKF